MGSIFQRTRPLVARRIDVTPDDDTDLPKPTADFVVAAGTGTRPEEADEQRLTMVGWRSTGHTDEFHAENTTADGTV